MQFPPKHNSNINQLNIKAMKRHFLITLLAMLAITACDKINQPEAAVGIGDTCPAFSVTLNDGTTVTEKTPDGKSGIMLIFFNTTCNDCQRELPIVQRVYDEYNDMVVICPVSRKETEKSIGEYWNAKKFTMPYSAQKDNNIYNKFASSGIPRIYIIKDGKVVDMFDDTDLPSYDMLSNSLKDNLELVTIDF